MDKHEILKKYFGYDAFREGQELLTDSILSGRDVLGIMPTGAGKSICYQVPALMFPGITLVISPLISLMKDQVQALNHAGIHAAYINSSLTENQIAKALQLAAAGQYKIIYVAPERLETSSFLWFAQHVEISMVAVDEAHCISQWGQDFRPSYLKIVRFVEQLPLRPVLSAFTATATGAVKEDIICVLGLKDPEILVTGFDRKNLYFGVETPKRKSAFLLDYVSEHGGDSGIIYCATRKNVEQVHELLCRAGLPATRYHAGLSAEERKCGQDDFIYDRKPVMVATNAFGMGIDKSNVRYVIHYNMPQSMENYYQEAGRAGRDGEPSECILLYSPQDVMVNRFLIENKEQKEENYDREELQAIRERDEERLRIMTAYCTTTDCLRRYILRYFGEQGADCGNCSNCSREYTEKNMTEEARAVIRCIREQGGRFGINVVTGTLMGGETAKLREYGVKRYTSFGALDQMREAEIKKLIQKLLQDGILCQTRDRYALLKLTPLAAEVADGKREVMIKIPLQAKEAGRKGDSGAAAYSGHEADGSRKQKSSRRSDILNSKGLECFDALRALRTEIAKEEAVPPYIVFSDKTLVDMCVRLPFTRAEMLRVTGVGEHKYEKYGERFIGRIKEFTGGVKGKYYFG
ncbi:MAG: DNA helicase RecQ [Eubacterium sp.]|nr:DNA helicase RecQ [Eubacterium sp.]MCM1216153.1 DNA helicase RecQ [Lachnospiraceae bacterium]MCM1304544.1 DNA helicase RecQ [Butyrivibrio sp.]MCM1344189.1 DNA helicase RecQ [Muribaculaceae bacterium]MCM1239075.1 DNA helicase RecQ [Lachnospiraceae bacterium]